MTLDVEPRDTVENIKLKIQYKEGIPSVKTDTIYTGTHIWVGYD